MTETRTIGPLVPNEWPALTLADMVSAQAAEVGRIVGRRGDHVVREAGDVADTVVGVGVADAGADDALVDQVEPVAGVLAEEVGVHLGAVVADPDLEGVEAEGSDGSVVGRSW